MVIVKCCRAGKYHAGVVSNCEDLEQCTVVAGRASGDLAHPLPYSPELHFNEFASAVADMKNSAAVSWWGYSVVMNYTVWW